MAVSHRKFIRNPEKVDEIVLGSLTRLHTNRVKAGSEATEAFPASIDNIVEAIDGRFLRNRAVPSRASIYRSVERLAKAGKFQIARKTERGNYTYKFGSTPNGSVTARTPTVRTTKKATTPEVPQTAPLAALIEEDRNLTSQLDELMAVLQNDIAMKKSQIAAAQELLARRELVAA